MGGKPGMSRRVLRSLKLLVVVLCIVRRYKK